MAVSVFAPISIGNVSVGFDTLGLCLTPVDGSLVGDIVTVSSQAHDANLGNPNEASQLSQFVLSGTHANKLPQDKESNIAWRCLQSFNHALVKKQISVQVVTIELHKNIPVSSGLGSSACSVVATFAALNLFYSAPFSETELLILMGELEAEISGSLHYDNVAPCYLGGLQLMLSDKQQICRSVPTFDDCLWVIAYPDIEVSTKAAREILPKSYPRSTLIEFGQNLAGFIDASYRQDKAQAFQLMKDIVAEPYRKSLLPNFEKAQTELSQLGALTVGISGSGPTLFAVADSTEVAEQLATWLKANYLQSEQGFVHICQVDAKGARSI